MKNAALVATLLSCLVATPALAGDLVVISSSMATYPPGTIMAGAKPIPVPAGASITLISSSGKSIRIDGPSTVVPEPAAAPGDNTLLEGLARIVSPPAGAATQLAVFRGGPRQRPDLWSVNVDREGIYCVPRERPPTLWRKRTGSAATATMGLSGASAVPTTWNAGSHLAPWPAGLSVRDDGRYVLRAFTDDAGRLFTVRLIPTTLPTDAHRAAWMHSQGCGRQARDLLDDIASRGD